MTTVNVQTVGTGKTFADLGAFFTWLGSRDLVANDEIVQAQVFNDQDFTTGLINTSSRWHPLTFDANHYCVVQPAPGAGVNDLETTGALTFGTSGIQLIMLPNGGPDFSHGVELHGLRILIKGTNSSTAYAMSNDKLSSSNGVRDFAMTNCRVLNQASAPSYVIDTAPSMSACRLEDNLFINEGSATCMMFRLNNYDVINRNTWINRGSAVGGSAATFYDATGTVFKDNMFSGTNNKPVNRDCDPTGSQTAAWTNNYAETALASPTNGFTVVNPTITSSTDYRPRTGTALIGGATTSAQNTSDLRGGFRGTVPDVGSTMLNVAALPNVANATITNTVVQGQKVTVTGTYTNSFTSVTGSLNAGGTPNGAVSTTTSVIASGGNFTAVFRNVHPGNYATPSIIFTNQSGSGTCSGGAPVTVAVPPAPTVAITSQTVSGNVMTITGTLTGYPVSATCVLPAATTPNGAVTNNGSVVINDDAQTFTATFSSIAYGNYAAPSVTVTNATANATATGSATTVYAPGAQPPGLPAVNLTAYSAPTFTSASVADHGNVAAVTIINTTGATINNAVFTFGHVFKKGQLQPGDGLNGFTTGGNVALQFEMKSTHTDGSIRHAVISGVLSTIAASSQVVMTLQRLATPTVGTTNAETMAQMITAGLGSTFAQVVIGGVTYVADCAAAMNANVTPYKLWLKGDICTEYVLHLPFKNTSDNTLHPTLTAQFAVRHYPGPNKAKIDITIEASKTYAMSGDVTYDVTLMAGGFTVYTQSGLVHYPGARWRKSYNWGGAGGIHIKMDPVYWLDSKQVPNYDRTLVMQESVLQGYSDLMTSTTNFNPMQFGKYNADMGATGGRDEIAIAPDTHAAWVISQDKRAKDIMVASANAAGSWTAHFRDHSTGPAAGQPLDIIHFPYSTILGTNSDATNPNTSQSEKLPTYTTASPGNAEDAHQAAYAYIPYLATGDFYLLEELHFWVQFTAIRFNPGYRNYSQGLLKNEQLRGQAWGIRTFSEAAYITPDAHPAKAMLMYMLNNNISYYNQTYTDSSPQVNALGCISELGVFVYANDATGQSGVGTAPWQDDFFTQAVGHAAELGSTEAGRLLLWKAKFQVGRMMATGYCWIQATMYKLMCRDTASGPIYADLATCYRNTVSSALWNAFNTYGCNSQQYRDQLNAERSLPSNPYLPSEMVGYSNDPEGYPSNFQPALALAVDSGYTNGDLAWDLFDGRANKPLYTDKPQFAVVPRTVSSAGGGGTVTVPGAPTNVLATAGAAQATVSFTAPASNGGAAITSYTVTASSGQTATGVGSPIVIAVPNGVAVTFTVHATNSVGAGPESIASNSVTPTAAGPSVPGAPTNTQAAVNANGTVNVTFSAPVSNGGSAITSYQVTSSAGGVFTGPTSPITATVPLDTAVSFTVKAINAVGPGPASSPSNSVTVASQATVTSVTVIPATATVNGAATQAFTAVVNGNFAPSQQVTWSTNYGSVDTNGTFTAPAAGIVPLTVTLTATSVLDNTKSGTATITVPASLTPPSSGTTIRHFGSNVLNKYGVAIEGAEVTVTNSDTGKLATLYKDLNKTPMNNPTDTDAEGYFEFYVDAQQCSYTVRGRGITTYTRDNIFDIISAVDLTAVQQAIQQLQGNKANIADVNALGASKANASDLTTLQAVVAGILDQLSKLPAPQRVSVQGFVTGGAGTAASPWTGWDTGITWSANTQYDFLDGVYAYATSPNFAKNNLKLNGRRNTVLQHTGSGYALLCDAGPNSTDIAVGVEMLNITSMSNVSASGGLYQRGCCMSKFDIVFLNMPNICATDISGVKNSYKLVHSPVGFVETIPPSQLLYTAKRDNSIDCTLNDYALTAENCTSFAIDLLSGVNCKFSGVSQLNNYGMYLSVNVRYCQFNGMDIIQNQQYDINCDGQFNRFMNMRSDSTSTFAGMANLITGGQYDSVHNKGTHNNFTQIAYAMNNGVFENGGLNQTKIRVYNLTTQNFDQELIGDVAFLDKLDDLQAQINVLKGV